MVVVQAKKQGLCEVGDQVVVSQCPSDFDRGIVKVRIRPVRGLPGSTATEGGITFATMHGVCSFMRFTPGGHDEYMR